MGFVELILLCREDREVPLVIPGEFTGDPAVQLLNLHISRGWKMGAEAHYVNERQKKCNSLGSAAVKSAQLSPCLSNLTARGKICFSPRRDFGGFFLFTVLASMV